MIGRKMFTRLAVGSSLAVALALTLTSAPAPTRLSDMPASKVQLTSAGPLAFGPDGVLFVADTLGGEIVAIDTNDNKAAKSAAKIDVQGIDQKIAALVGVMPDQIVINSVKVNPVSKNVYLSASRGKGPDAMPLILRVDATGKLTLFSLDNVKHESVKLTDAPAADPKAQRDPRLQTITDMAYVNGNLMVAGASNEEWSSAMRSIPYPFTTAAEGATIQIWHSSHGRYETAAPVRTLVPYSISGKDYILAAYTCTPLVKIPVSDLKPGAKVKGVTIADLGSGNQPLDMLPYKKDGHSFILIANSNLGLMKLKADNLQTYPAIDSPTVTDVAGVPYDKISDLKDVRHLAQLDDSDALILSGKAGAGVMNLSTIALP